VRPAKRPRAIAKGWGGGKGGDGDFKSHFGEWHWVCNGVFRSPLRKCPCRHG
jgi:hypothetical protein